MKSFEAQATIRAKPDDIWAILVDAPHYRDWDSGVVSVEGTITKGESIKVVSSVNPGRTFPVKVTTFEPSRTMTWSGGLPLGLFKGERTFTLTDDGKIRFEMIEIYTGPLLPLMGRSIPDLGPSFEQFAAGLRKRAESAA